MYTQDPRNPDQPPSTRFTVLISIRPPNDGDSIAVARQWDGSKPLSSKKPMARPPDNPSSASKESAFDAAPTTSKAMKTSIRPAQAKHMSPELQLTLFQIKAHNELLKQAQVAFNLKIAAIILSISCGVGGVVFEKSTVGSIAAIVGGGAALGCDRLVKDTRDCSSKHLMDTGYRELKGGGDAGDRRWGEGGRGAIAATP